MEKKNIERKEESRDSIEVSWIEVQSKSKENGCSHRLINV